MKYFFIILTFIGLTSCHIQNNVDLKATKFCFRQKSTTDWQKFSNWDSTNIKVKMFKRREFVFNKSYILVNDNEPIYYKVTSKVVDSVDPDGREFIVLACKDLEGDRCSIYLYNYDNYIKMYIHHPDIHYCYYLVLDDEVKPQL